MRVAPASRRSGVGDWDVWRQHIIGQVLVRLTCHEAEKASFFFLRFVIVLILLFEGGTYARVACTQ